MHPQPGPAQPFLKWAGGKRALAPRIARLLPPEFQTYWEPFTGGGALFFTLEARIRTAHLSDINPELAITYQAVRNQPEELIEMLNIHAEQHAFIQDNYYQVRDQPPSQNGVETAAKLIYLNHTCYNGLYRVNRHGQFNVPEGGYLNPLIHDPETIRRASKALQKADIKHQDFGEIRPGEKDIIYCDPPYHQTFQQYSTEGFGEDEHQRLRDQALAWRQAGAQVAVSNSDTPLIHALYGTDFTITQLSAPRLISARSDRRGPVTELFITTYQPPIEPTRWKQLQWELDK